MRFRRNARKLSPGLDPGDLRIDISQQELLEDLFFPTPPPGRWILDERGPAGYGRGLAR